MSTVREILRQEVAEGGSALLTAYFEDEAGAQIPLAGLATVRLWLDNQADGATINGKSNTDIKNANGGTVAEVDGRTKLTLTLAPADNPIVDPTLRTEWHLATISATYNGGAAVVRKEYLFRVVNLSEV